MKTVVKKSPTNKYQSAAIEYVLLSLVLLMASALVATVVGSAMSVRIDEFIMTVRAVGPV